MSEGFNYFFSFLEMELNTLEKVRPWKSTLSAELLPSYYVFHVMQKHKLCYVTLETNLTLKTDKRFFTALVLNRSFIFHRYPPPLPPPPPSYACVQKSNLYHELKPEHSSHISENPSWLQKLTTFTKPCYKTHIWKFNLDFTQIVLL